MVSNLTVLEGIFETKLKDWFFFEIFFYRISFKIEGELNKFLMDFSFKIEDGKFLIVFLS